MINWKNICFNLTLALNCLIGLFLVFYDRLAIPAIVQVAGRAHPLLLHFPIVLVALYIGWIFVVPKNRFSDPQLYTVIARWLLLASAFTAALTALTGILLSKEPGYNPESLFWHKWLGVALSLFCFGWLLLDNSLQKSRPLSSGFSLAGLLLLVLGAHQGASITHGEGFLLSPVESKTVKKVLLADALVYTDMVRPILEEKCMGCHNNKKAKGELVMETRELLLKGGKSGALWDTANVDLSLLLQRIHLPLEQKKHMPPSGKQQLTDQELAILYQWIRKGADFKLKVSQLPAGDSLRTLAENLFSADAIEDYEFAAASEKTLSKLNTNYRAVTPLAKGSPGIAVDFYGPSFYKPEQVKDLLEIKTQLVALNLEKMPVADPELSLIGQFTNLRTLNLSFTNISGSALTALNTLTHLKSLSLANCKVSTADLLKLTNLKELQHLYIWNTAIPLADGGRIKKSFPNLDLQTGMRTDTMTLRLNPPLVQNEEQILDTAAVKLKLKHYVPGVIIRYSLDGKDPDSLNSPIYNENSSVSNQVLMKARAFKPGWNGSEVVQYQFYKSTLHPDTIILITPADSSYRGKGGKTLYDMEKGNLSFGSGKWLAYRKNRLECMLEFRGPINPSSLTISSLVDVGSMIFNAKSIMVSGGKGPKDLQPLGRLVPAMDTVMLPGHLVHYDLPLHARDIRYIKVVIEPFGKLPKKIALPKNDLGWFFIDEVMIN